MGSYLASQWLLSTKELRGQSKQIGAETLEITNVMQCYLSEIIYTASFDMLDNGSKKDYRVSKSCKVFGCKFIRKRHYCNNFVIYLKYYSMTALKWKPFVSYLVFQMQYFGVTLGR